MTKFIPVLGYLAKNWTELNAHAPAVVVNPEAQPLDLLAWCWGEFLSMQSAANVLADGSDDISRGDFSALIIHRMDAFSGVFEFAISRLVEEKRQTASGTMKPMPAAGMVQPTCSEVAASGRA